MKTKRKAFVIQPLGTGFREAGPAVSYYSGMLSDGCWREGGEGWKLAFPPFIHPLSFSGNSAGKNLTALTAQVDPPCWGK